MGGIGVGLFGGVVEVTVKKLLAAAFPVFDPVVVAGLRRQVRAVGRADRADLNPTLHA